MSTVLVIDDEELFRQTTALALQRKGFLTLEAPDGRAGCDLASRRLPDLVLCDLHMEPMNGYATLETLRKQPATATIPFILMTGMGDDRTMRQGMNLGADDFLAKPFNAAQLCDAVNARLRKQRELRQAAEKKLADLRANLSLALPHELFTPLNGIFGLAEILTTCADTLSPEEVADTGKTILQSAERLHRLTQNFLLYGQLEMLATDPAGQQALRSKSTPHLGPVLEARARLSARQAGREADLVLELADAAAALAQDMAEKIAGELLDNAFKFSAPGQPVQVSLAVEGPACVLRVRDCGCGLSAAHIAAIGAYAQFDRQSREQQGSGLGLAIARRVAELHGGSLAIESEPGAGATVIVKLPLPPGN
jgi:signal transduction histidine kinase